MNHNLGLQECRYLPLPPSVKKEIQEQFAAGVSLERIIDSNKCTVEYNNTYQIIH